MKKTLAFLLALVLLVGCFSFGALAEEKEPVTLTITTSLYVEAPHQKALDGLIEAYKKVAPHVTINVYGAAYDNYWDNITAEIVAGTEPDIIQMYQENIGRYDSMRLDGTFLNLDSWLVGTEYEDILTAQAYCKYNGVYKAISSYATSTSALYYRKSMLAEAGIDPESIKTMEDWRQALIKLSDGNKYGVGFIVGAHTFTANEWARILARPVSGGVFFTGKEGLETGYTAENINANHPGNVWAAEWWTNLIQEGAARVVDSKKTSRELFMNGEVAFNHDGSWFVGTLEERDPALLEDVGVIPIPQVEYEGTLYKANPTLYAVVSCVSANSKNPEEAMNFLLWMTSDEAQEIIEVCGMVPSNSEYVKKSGYAERHPLNDAIEQLQHGIYDEVLISDPPIAEQGELLSILTESCQAIFSGDISAQEGLDEAAELMKEVMQ